MPDLYTISQKLNALINITETAIENIRLQHFWKTSYNIQSLSAALTEYFTLSAEVFDKTVTSNLLSYLQEMLKAQSISNYVLLGDILEIHLLPSFYEMQGAVLSNITLPQNDYFENNIKQLSEKNCPEVSELAAALRRWHQAVSDSSSQEARSFTENYIIEPTNSGCLTLNKSCENQFYYFHSNQNPRKEGELFADSYSSENIFDYIVIGLGLGYHIAGLLRRDARYHVTVLESDIHILGAAFQYMDLKYILTCGRAQIIYLPDFCGLGKYISKENSKLVIHYPTLLTLKEGSVKDSLKNYFINLSTAHEQKQLLNENFYYNQKWNSSSIDKEKENFKQKDVIYIGGGPSAETKLSSIKNYTSAHPDTITICAGTVYRKLLASGFSPDFVIISDAQAGLSRQLTGIPETDASLIYLATASHNAVRVFNGRKYIAYQSGFPSSEEAAAQNGYTLFSTGGSVSTFAIDLAIRFGCKRLITAGLDLSFPKNKTHGFALSGNIASDTFSITVPDLHGNPVQTSQPLNSYRKWIEQRIQSESSVEFINITEGAYIQGMKNLDSFPS